MAEVSRKIEQNKEEVFRYTNKWNTVVVVSDGSRVLGLGNIGSEAALPVMEGKALLFKFFGGVDAVPICLDTTDKEEIIRTAKILQPEAFINEAVDVGLKAINQKIARKKYRKYELYKIVHNKIIEL